jgi:hypothetical protein
MTVFLPLREGTATPPSPSFLCPASEPADYWKRVIKAILKAKHIAVVCGEHPQNRVASYAASLGGRNAHARMRGGF